MGGLQPGTVDRYARLLAGAAKGELSGRDCLTGLATRRASPSAFREAITALQLQFQLGLVPKRDVGWKERVVRATCKKDFPGVRAYAGKLHLPTVARN